MADADALSRLRQIEHIVVVMMENRSFDHMLGYLSLYGLDEVNGLRGEEFNFGPDGSKIGIHAFDADANRVMRRGEALDKGLDPDHSKDGVQTQLGTGYPGADGSTGPPNGGFVKAFVESRAEPIDADLHSVPMGFYTAKDLPTYDHLARNYCVCDAWHSSVPGDTWPNRLYSIAGHEGDRTTPGFLSWLARLLRLKALRSIAGAPIFDVPAFTRHLDDGQWRWYSHDPATLRAVDGRYRDVRHVRRENFAYFDRKQVSLVTEVAEALIVGRDSFLDDAANGRLRGVSWIDPNFIDLDVLDPNSNDDHPPSDIRAGQAFILELYEALRRSPNWEDTLLVVVYDEHGGFYDHQPPPAIADGTGYATLGVRVPALVAGPRARRFVCHDVLQHTSLIKTILLRFAADPDRAIAAMPPRVASSEHLGGLLEDAPRDDIPPPDEARAAIDLWRTAARARRQADPAGAPSPAPDGAGQPLVLHDFQEEFARFALEMRRQGLPPGQT